MNGTTLLSVITGALVLGGLLGSVISGLRRGNSSQQSEVIQLQQSEVAAFKSANDRLEKDKAALLAENEALKKSNADLKEIAQQTPEIKELIKQIATMNKTLGKLVTK